MNSLNYSEEELFTLLDAYLDGTIDEPQIKRLEAVLIASDTARATFVRYCRMETDLHLAVRSRRAGEKAMRFIEEAQWEKAAAQAEAQPALETSKRLHSSLRLGGWKTWVAMAACLLVAAALTWRGRTPQKPEEPDDTIAWLVNAQDCQWLDQTGQGGAAGRMRAGEIVALGAGLAEIEFGRGAKAIVEGPAQLELLSDNSARLTRGKLAARVSDSAHGFEVQLPQGKVVDLGTEFGVAVAQDGTSDVYVFAGRVDAYADKSEVGKASVVQNQAARLGAGRVVVDTDPPGDTNHFVRAIAASASVAPRTVTLNFHQRVDSSVRDRHGWGTGLNDRLPGTGTALYHNDLLLALDVDSGRLDLIPSKSDINMQTGLGQGEYLGVRLADLGFKGPEDFEISARVTNLPAMRLAGQFGLYAGTDSRHNIRGGLIGGGEHDRFGAFLVSKDNGRDAEFKPTGSLARGSNVRMTLRRLGGEYSLTMENQTEGTTNLVRIPRPASLENEKDLHVGFYGATALFDVRTRLSIREIQVKVWQTPPAQGEQETAN